MDERPFCKKIIDKFLPTGTKRRQAVKLVYRPVKSLYQSLLDMLTLMSLHYHDCYLLTEFKIDRQKGLVILTRSYTNFVAELLQQALAKIDIPSEIIYERPEKGYKKLPHIVICPLAFAFLPKRYIAFQMEQSINPRWFTKKYWQVLNLCR